jgi:ComF family protein
MGSQSLETVTQQPGLVKSTPPTPAWIGKAKTVALDLLFPPHCAACQRFGAWLCADCLDEIEAIEPPVCQLCGLPLSSGDRVSVCTRCEVSPMQLDGLRSYAVHGGALRKAIHQFKYEGLRGLADLLGQLMTNGWNRLAPGDLEMDVVVPVPLHRNRQRQRGYNQAALLARELGSYLKLPVVEGAMVRSKPTVPQVDLGVVARRANVQDAFECRGNGLAGMRVLLVDDVCTSGATLESACLALRGAGVSSVWACTLTRATPDTGAPSPPGD